MKFRWPLTIIAGKNGSGKTTFLQACALAPKRTGENKLPAAGFVFPKPFPGETPVAVSGKSRIHYIFSNRSWNYTRKYVKNNWDARKVPSWSARYRPISSDVPSQEAAPARVKSSGSIKAMPSVKVSDEVLGQLRQMLLDIDSASTFNMIGRYSGTRTPPSLLLEKDGIVYPDWNAGGGEQKVFRYAVEFIQLPDNSLILLEEPEATLHPDLQRRLAMFLLWLCHKKHHQIIITTHSPELYRWFPPEAKVFLERRDGNVHVQYGVDSFQVETLLAESVYTNKDIILVEDEHAKYFLDEILELRPLVRDQSSVVVFRTDKMGGKDIVREATGILHESGIRVVAVRDHDAGENPDTFMLRLPAMRLSELNPLWDRIEVQWLSAENLSCLAKDMPRIENAYKNARSRFVTPRSKDIGYYKDLFKALSEEMKRSDQELSKLLIKAWLEPEENKKKAIDLAEDIQKNSQRCQAPNFEIVDLMPIYSALLIIRFLSVRLVQSLLTGG